jgi:CheY-like chemotaxis protein
VEAADVSVTVQPDRATIRVKDSGIGFSPEEQSLLFTLFGRLQPQTQGDGLGIGLALAKKLVELHGGSIAAASDGKNKGSCFSVSLPVDEACDRAAPREHTDELAKFEGHRVLVVDDNHDAADSLAELLRMLGCETAVFYDGAKALHALDQFAPTIAFIDLGMPGMDGCQLAQHVRGHRDAKGVRLVALTGLSQPEDRARSDAAGFDHHMTKPVSFVQLNDVLRDSADRDH